MALEFVTSASIASDRSASRVARSFVAERMLEAGASRSITADLVLVASELVSNAVEHTSATDLQLSIGFEGRRWSLSVSTPESGAGGLADPSAWVIAPPDRASGRGLGIVRHLVDDVAVAIANARVVVTCGRIDDPRPA